MDQAHEQIADRGPVQRAIERRVLTVQSPPFQASFNDVASFIRRTALSLYCTTIGTLALLSSIRPALTLPNFAMRLTSGSTVPYSGPTTFCASTGRQWSSTRCGAPR